MTKQEISQTIIDQIKHSDRVALMAWGASKLVMLGEEKIGDRYQIGGLMMNVRGLKHTGKVLVRLMGNDTYMVEIGKVNCKLEWITNAKADGVYCDELMATIDGMIER